MALNPGNSSPRVAYASELGCKLDVDFSTGLTASGSAPTDNTGALNAFLAGACAGNPIKLILDGPALVRGLVISADGYTTIEGLGWGTGIYLADGANQDAIRLGPYNGGQTEGQGVHPVPPRRATAVVLRNLAIYGNGNKSFTGTRQGITPRNVPIAGAPEHAIFGVALTNCRDVLLDHVQVIQAPCYGVMLANASDVRVVGCSFLSDRAYQDGVHLDGPTERVSICGCRFATGDDAIALNAPEGFGGDIEDVQVSDCVFVSSFTLMRVYTSFSGAFPVWRVRRLVVSGCTGTTVTPSFNLGLEGNLASRVPDQLEDMLITDCSLRAPGMVSLKTPAGLLTISDCAFRQTASATPVVRVRSSARQLTLANVTLMREAAGGLPAAFVGMDSPAGVETLTFAGVRVSDEALALPALPALLAPRAPLQRLLIEAVDMTNIAALVDPATGFATVGSVAGGGLLGAGVPLPDAKVAPHTLYVSAEAGMLSFNPGTEVVRLG